jgi:hypothetical protein
MCIKEVGVPLSRQQGTKQVFPSEKGPASLRTHQFILLSLLLGLFGCGGVNLKNTNTLSATPSSVTFGTVAIGKTAAASVSLKNLGIVPVEVSNLNTNVQSFSVIGNTLPTVINPGASYNVAVQFNPAATGPIDAQLVVGTGASSVGTTKIALSGSGTPGLAGLNCALSSVSTEASDSCTVTLNAAAPTGGLIVSLSSTDSAVMLPASITVPANSTSVTFNASVSTVSAAQSATLTASATGSSSSFALKLVPGGPILSVNSTGVAFGTTALNMPVTQDLVLTASGNQPVSVVSAVLAGAGFTIPGATFPFTLNPGQTATLHLEFDPKTLGAANGQLTIKSNSVVNSVAAIAMSGTAVAYGVQLTWNAPSSNAITGYKVLRSTGGNSTYQLLNSSAVPDTTYTDTTVQSGDVYDYIVESVDASGTVSGPSNTTTVAIP